MAEDKKNKSAYTAESISVLEGLDPVRKRPGMYIGSTGKDGLHHLVWEVVDNAIDEAMAGHCTEIEVALLPDGRVRVSDNGRGIPVEVHKQTKVSALETVLTILHAGGKFGGGGYKVSGGLHGVGVSVVNALSSHLIAEVKRGGKIYIQEYKIGKPQVKVKELKDAKKAFSPKRFKTGTTIVFEPDMSIFSEDAKLSWTKILERLRQQAYLTKGIRIIVSDEEKNRQYGFFFETGIRAFIHYLNRARESKQSEMFYVDKEKDGIIVESAFQYTDELQPLEYFFANNIHNPEGGMHLTGFRTALTRTINDYAKKNSLIKDAKDALTGDDVREGLTVIVSVKVPEPQFEGQTKAKLGNPEVRTVVDSVISEALADFLDRCPSDARQIVGKCLLANKARLAAKAARDTIIRKGALEGMTLPGKLADCSSRDADACELYIVEGDSAGGCFFGKTKVALADGRNLSFIDLEKEEKEGKKNYCYTIKKDGFVGLEQIKNVRKTKENAEVIKIILDNDEEIICTPDHNFMLRDGNYKMAKDLIPENSLMPFYKKLSKKEGRITIEGYEMVWDIKNDRWIFTHLLADKYNLEKGIYLDKGNDNKHHIDFNKLNNNPDNIIRMSRKAHPEKKEELMLIAKKQWEDSNLLGWRSQKTKEQWTSDFRQKRKLAYDQTYYNHTIKFLKNVLEQYGTLEKYDNLRTEKRNTNLLKFSTFCNRFFGGNKNYVFEAVKNYNHKIKKIVKLRKKVDVYDLEVENTHNFALAAGVFVHNSAKQGRDRKFQAILPLKGKILNVEKARLDKILSSQEIKALIIAMGAGVGEHFDIEKMRYHRIIIMTDADVDGNHITTLLLTLYYRHFPEIISKGYLYIAQPPLYRVQSGKKVEYAYTDIDKQEIIEEMQKGKKSAEVIEGESDEKSEEKVVGVNVQRYKGLGEMNPSQLWETTMNPENRVMKKVMVEDAEEADNMFNILMGDDVKPRKLFIQTHAKSVKNLDI